MDDQKILLKVGVDQKSISDLAALKKQIDDLKSAQKGLDKTTEDGRKQFESMNIQIKSLTKEYNNQTKGLVNANGKIGGLKGKWIEFKDAATGALGGISNGFSKFAKTIITNPIGLAITAIVAVFNKLREAFQKNDDAGTALQKLFASFKPLLDTINGLFNSLVEALIPVFEWLGTKIPAAIEVVLGALGKIGAWYINIYTKIVTGVLSGIQSILIAIQKAGKFIGIESGGIQSAIDGIGNAIDKVNTVSEKAQGALQNLGKGYSDATKEAQNLVSAADLLEEKQRQFTKNEAQRNAEISELRAKAAEKDKYTNQERLDFLDEAIRLEEKNLKDRQALAAEAYRITVENNKKNSDTSDEAKNKEAELYASMLQAKTEYNNGVRRLNSEASTLRQNIQKEYDDLMQQLPELQKAMGDLAKSANQVELDKATEPYDVIIQKAQEGIEKFASIGRELSAEEQTQLDGLNAIIVQATKERGEAVAKVEEEQAKRATDAKASEIQSQSALEVLKAQNANKSAKEIYDIELKSIQDRMALYSEDSKEYQELLKEKTALTAAFNKNQEDAVKETFQKNLEVAQNVVNTLKGASEVAGEIISIVNEQENAQFENYERQQNTKKEILKNRLEQGLIDQHTYEQGVQKLDAETEEKQKALQLKQAKRQKAMAIMNATLNAAAAIIASLAMAPVAIGIAPNPMGIASLALATTMGAIQIAAAAATPLPKAAKGGIAGGGILQGPSHSQGGIHIEAEGGEAIINKKSTAKYRDLLSAINESGGGVSFNGSSKYKFATGGLVNDGGYATKGISKQFNRTMPPIYVSVEEINRGQDNYAKVVENRTI